MIELEQIHPVIFGGGALNNIQYGADTNLEPLNALRYVFSLGINAIDTSAYYGDSEVIIGKALKTLANEYPRESYFLSTKAGRWENNEFDYSEPSIRRSVMRSLERLGTDYLDLLLIHDVEFQTIEQALVALKTAFDLKKNGVVRYVGFSGYPLDYMLELALAVAETIEPVDAILSYCNLTLQNTLLQTFKPKFIQAGVKKVINASPLSMSLLRSAPTHEWHPAPQGLKDETQKIADELLHNGVELADLAEQYAFATSSPTVVGMRSPMEVQFAMDNYKVADPNNKYYKFVQETYGKWLNVTWPSGIH